MNRSAERVCSFFLVLGLVAAVAGWGYQYLQNNDGGTVSFDGPTSPWLVALPGIIVALIAGAGVWYQHSRAKEIG